MSNYLHILSLEHQNKMDQSFGPAIIEDDFIKSWEYVRRQALSIVECLGALDRRG